ncbi:SUMO-specific isopeptidase USPL1-like, partial [Melanotaenia boesemani]|uniref:SUMO-specific isopeptidase USPL1-like n=1 Tax=Melanotaenia boesemani TaxID=1250792 RepID=UPI001C04F027
VAKTLPTFTNIVPNWHPLHAAHFAPCNMCSKNNQMRTMLLQRVPAVFALHFVEGLPDNDVSIYAFSFKGKRYSVTTVIQYIHHIKHFVTWLHNNDGSWLEYDDLKYPNCLTHERLQVPAHEMHVVFWEVEDDAEPSVCSPSTTFVESLSPEINDIPLLNDKADEPSALTPDQTLLIPHNDTDIICALSGEDNSNIIDTTISAGDDASIGATTLLDTFEGLTHNDIVTLTLVEIKADSEKQLLNDTQQAQDVPARTENLNSKPDSSSHAAGSDVCHGADVDPPTIPSSSDTESKDSSCDPLVSATKRGRGRGAVSRQMGEKIAPSITAPHTPPAVSLEPSEVVIHKPESPAAQDKTPPAEVMQQASPVSSTNTSPLATNQKSSTELPALDQNARWCFLLSKHPLNHIHKSIAKLAPTHTPSLDTQVKPSHPIHSTPNPVKGQPILAGLHKEKLNTEESEDLPPKAAEMYGGFGTKVVYPPSPCPAPLIEESKHFKPINSNATVLSGLSPPTSAAKQLAKIGLSKKHSSQSSKVPLGLSDTEALRYKLIKKLKAKKKKLAKLNSILGHQGGLRLQPDSTDLNSPSTVTSSTYDGSTCDDFLSDLLSPSTTVSNLSPDSTGFLEMLASGKDGAKQLDCLVGADGASSQTSCGTDGPDTENFLEDFLSQCCGFDTG